MLSGGRWWLKTIVTLHDCYGFANLRDNSLQGYSLTSLFVGVWTIKVYTKKGLDEGITQWCLTQESLHSGIYQRKALRARKL